MSHSDEEINVSENFNVMMKKIEKTMEEIDVLEKSKTSFEESKKTLQNFYTRFLIFVIITNHFHTLVDTNYSLVSMIYNTIDEVEFSERKENKDFEDVVVIDYAEGLQIEEVD